MKITTRDARIEGAKLSDSKEGAGFIDVDAICSGYVPRLRFYPSMGHFVIASQPIAEGSLKALFLFILPAPEWEQELVNDGYVIEQRFSDMARPTTPASEVMRNACIEAVDKLLGDRQVGKLKSIILDALRTVKVESIPAGTGDRWQSIESAPKDGTEIILSHGNSVWFDSGLTIKRSKLGTVKAAAG